MDAPDANKPRDMATRDVLVFMLRSSENWKEKNGKKWELML
jgi:hypothetical protein